MTTYQMENYDADKVISFLVNEKEVDPTHIEGTFASLEDMFDFIFDKENHRLIDKIKEIDVTELLASGGMTVYEYIASKDDRIVSTPFGYAILF